MCNIANILQTANMRFKKIPCRHLATVDDRFDTLQRIRLYESLQPYRRKKHKSTHRSNEKQDAKVI